MTRLSDIERRELLEDGLDAQRRRDFAALGAAQVRRLTPLQWATLATELAKAFPSPHGCHRPMVGNDFRM